MKLTGSIVYFGIPTVAFFLFTNRLIPHLIRADVHPALAWFIAGYLTFIPLFVCAIVFTIREGNRSSSDILVRLRLTAPTRRDWTWTLAGLAATIVGTGVVFGVAMLIAHLFGLPPLSTSPHFLSFEPLQGNDRLLLLVWAPMFFFNIVGEELFWRGYILPRQEAAFTRRAWLVNACLWTVFHVAFGWHLLLLLAPILFIVPYVAQRTRNTWPGIVIHGLLNGPGFVMVSLGVGA
jgi:membrane protease YdiL (CAAX protease family)